MKLLFNKDNDQAKANQEVKDIIGAISTSFKWVNLKSDCYIASKDFIREFGKDLYQYLVDKYETSELEDSEEELISLCRYAILLRTLFYYLPKNDVAITNNGRTMFRDDNTVTAFEYQIDNQDEAIERTYYRTLDEIFSILNETNPKLTAGVENGEESNGLKWRETDIYKQRTGNFIQSIEQLDMYFVTESYYLLQKLFPAIKQCQRTEILPILTKEVYDTVIQKKETKYKEVYSICQEMCAYYAFNWGIKRLRVNMFPSGIFQAIKSERNTIKARSVSKKREAELVAQEFQRDFLSAQAKLQTAIKNLNNINTESTSDIITGDDNFISL